MRAAGVLLILVGSGYALELWTLSPIRCARAASHAQQILTVVEHKSDPVRSRAAADVQMQLRECNCTPSGELHLALAAAAETAGDSRVAAIEYGRALEFDRRPEIYLALGIAQAESLDEHDAIDSLVRACAFDPSRLAEIPYDGLREETRTRIRAIYGDDWLP